MGWRRWCGWAGFLGAVVAWGWFGLGSPVLGAAGGADSARRVAALGPVDSTAALGRRAGASGRTCGTPEGTRLRRGQTLYGVLVRGGVVEGGELQAMARAVKDEGGLSALRAGTELSWCRDRQGGLAWLSFELDPDRRLVIEARGEGRFEARVEAIRWREVDRVALGRIETSLFAAGRKAGLPPALLMDLTDIFAWDIDFASDLRRGDSFEVLFSELHRPGRERRPGRILAARLTIQGRRYEATWYRDASGREDYYDGEGKSLRKAFLKSPLRYRRISSTFTKRRYHPILKRYRPHLGVDFAAPVGTPVSSIGDGRVTFAGRKGGYGKMVIVRHNGIYTSYYSHLSRIAPGIRRGTVVRQGQTIGRVGSTGLSTGPHLDLRITKRGRFVNPLTLDVPPGRPVDDVRAYRSYRADVLSRLDQLIAQRRQSTPPALLP